MTTHHGSRLLARQLPVWFLLLGLLATAGCGKPGQLTGKVSFKGKLLPSGRVVFFNASNRQVASATISAEGTYSATVPSGTLKIAVITPPPETLKSMPKAKQKQVLEQVQKMKKGAFNPLEGEGAESIPQKVISVPPKYADPEGSGLTIEVLGGPQSFDIDLQ